MLTLLAAVLALAFASCAGGVKLVKFELPESPTAEIGSEYTLQIGRASCRERV